MALPVALPLPFDQRRLFDVDSGRRGAAAVAD
jgi:hypothetical protein